MSDGGYEWPSEMSDKDYEERFGRQRSLPMPNEETKTAPELQLPLETIWGGLLRNNRGWKDALRENQELRDQLAAKNERIAELEGDRHKFALQILDRYAHQVAALQLETRTAPEKDQA